MKKTRYIRSAVVILGLIVLFYAVPIIPSVLIMTGNNIYHGRDGLWASTGVEIDLPAGRIDPDQQWYPFMLKYNAGSHFERVIGRNAELSILYNFGSYTGRGSRFYNVLSPYCGAFYGAYLVQEKGNETGYGYEEGQRVSFSDLEAVAQYDYTRLVLRALGADPPILFEQSVTGQRTESFGGYVWDRIDAEIQTQSPTHRKKDFSLSYLQYGYPLDYEGEDFPVVTMYSRVWIRYFQEEDLTVAFYAMSPSQTFLEAMGEEIIGRAQVRFK